MVRPLFEGIGIGWSLLDAGVGDGEDSRTRTTSRLEDHRPNLRRPHHRSNNIQFRFRRRLERGEEGLVPHWDFPFGALPLTLL